MEAAPLYGASGAKMVKQIAGFHIRKGRRLTGSDDQDQAVLALVTPTVRWLVAQERSRLRQALGPEATQIMADVESATEELETVVARKVEARLPELLWGEVHRLFDAALSGREGLSAGLQRALIGQREARGAAGPVVGGSGGWKAKTEDSVLRVHPGVEVVAGQLSASPRNKEETAEADEGFPEHELYEGTVMLTLEGDRTISQVVQFVRELCREPEIRLQKLRRTHKRGVDIWLALRRPIRLKNVIPNIEGVTLVSEPVG